MPATTRSRRPSPGSTARLPRAELVPVFRALIEHKPAFEASLDQDYILPSWETPKEEQKNNWQQAWQAVAADAVLCGPSNTIAEFVEKKGYEAKTIRSSSMVAAAARFGIKTDSQVLSENEKKGKEILPATVAAQAAVDTVWSWLVKYNMTNDKAKPPVGCFRDAMNAGVRCLGLCDDTGVYLADDQASGDVPSKACLKTALRSVCTGSRRPATIPATLQNFAFCLIVEILA